MYSSVFFTRDLSAQGLINMYRQVAHNNIRGKIGIKLHTGEPHGPNIIPRDWVKKLIESEIPNADIVETNVAYDNSPRFTTEGHRQVLKINGWDFCKVNIMDEFGTAMLPIQGGKWFKEINVGYGLMEYNYLVVLTHFKGHTMGGFGGSNKNIGIGCASGRIGKPSIHSTKREPKHFDIFKDELCERFTESAAGVVQHFGENIIFINVLRNMSVSCDCEGTKAEPVVTPDIGILASRDILAIDQASVDLVYALPNNAGKALIERMESRHGLHQLTYMEKMGMGSRHYSLFDMDNNQGVPTSRVGDLVRDIKPV